MDGTIKTATDVMIRYGREQYEDAAVYHAVAVYVADIATVPAGAWGELPWSQWWRQRWEKGLDHRVREAHLMAEHTGEHAAAVLKAAADYALTNALNSFSELLLQELRDRHQQAIGLISIDEQRRKEQSDPGTLAHDTAPFPEHDQTLWADGRMWIPNQGRGSAPQP